MARGLTWRRFVAGTYLEEARSEPCLLTAEIPDATVIAADPGLHRGGEALALLIDVACETRGVDYFRSEDPMAAARSVVSDAAALLWRPYETGTGSRCSQSGRRPS